MENDSSLKYFKAWLNLSSYLNPQWTDSLINENFIKKSNTEICKLYREMFLNLNLQLNDSVKGCDVERSLSSKYGLFVNNDNGSKIIPKIPFRIEKNVIFGRHLVSNRNIDAGEVLVIEGQLARGPIAQFPYEKETPSCVICYSDACTYLCPNCGIYLCRREICKKKHASSLECIYLSRLGLVNEQQHIHNLEEKDFRGMIMNQPQKEWIGCCRTISDAYVKFIKEQKNNILNYYPAIPTLNMLCLLEKCKAIKGIILSLQGNIVPGSRRYKVNQKYIVNVIKKMKLPYTEDFIHKMAAIWDTNAFQSVEEDRKFQVIFALSSLFTHSCKPNCENIFMKGSQIMIFRAVEDISNGTILTISYTDLFWPTYIRRDHLEVSKNFICECERCSDFTEYGTFSGHSFCDFCKEFSVGADVCKERYKSLVCNNCSYQINSAKFFIVEAAACDLLSKVIVSDLKTYEEIVTRLSETFKNRYHDNHYIFQRIRLSLFLEHSIKDLSVLSDGDLKKMLDLISELWKFCSAILPRLSRRKAQVSNEFIRYVNETISRNGKVSFSDEDIKMIKKDAAWALRW